MNVLDSRKCIAGFTVLGDAILFRSDLVFEIRARVCRILVLRRKEAKGVRGGWDERRKHFSVFCPCTWGNNLQGV